MSRPPDLAFVACIEAGVLERQALLLFESIRAYGGVLADSAIYALAPRAGLGVGSETRRRLDALRVVYVDKVLNTECVDYGSANRVAAAAYIEGAVAHQLIVVLDSDTLVLREPEAFLLARDVDAAVRPVDFKGMCTSGPGDPHEEYWRQLCETCGVRYDDIPWTQSYVDDLRGKASYNGGLVVVRSDRGILRRWSEFFLASVRAGLRPQAEAVWVRSSTGAVSAPASRMWGSNQAALSLAIWSTTRRVLTLEPTYNYPLHAHEALGERRARDFDQLVHVHYHWLFEPNAIADNPITAATSTLAPAKLAWLRARTPFKPTESRAGARAPRPAPWARPPTETRPSDPSESARLPGQRGLLVLGMHRSGTSAITRTLSLVGAQLSSRLLEPAFDNARGHWESADLKALHDRVLESAGTSWEDFSPFPAAWHASGVAEGFRQEIVAILQRDFANSPLFVIKDPRMCRLVPLWTSVLERFGAEPAFLLAFRNPVEVAESLKVRNGFLPAKSLLLWLRHVIDAERGSRGGRRVLVSYEALLEDWRAVVQRVGRELGLEWPRLSEGADAAAEAFLDPRMHHQQSTLDEVRRRPEVLDWARALYEALVSAEAGSSSNLSGVVDGIGAELDLANRAFGPVVEDLGLSIAHAQSCAEQTRAALTAARAEIETRERDRVRLRGDLADALARTRQLELELAGKRLTEPLRRVLRRSPRAARLVRSALRVAKLPSWTKVRSLLGGLARASAGRPGDEVKERSQEEGRRPQDEMLARGRIQED